MLGLKPTEFWRLTPAELGDMLAGATWREERQWTRLAWQTAHLINVSGKMTKRTVTADELLGRPRKVKVKDPVADFHKLWAQVEAEREADSGG